MRRDFRIKGIVEIEVRFEVAGLLVGGVRRYNRYVDLNAIRDPDNELYIPGSSVKGRIRQLLEIVRGYDLAIADRIVEKYYEKLIEDANVRRELSKLNIKDDKDKLKEIRNRLINNYEACCIALLGDPERNKAGILEEDAIRILELFGSPVCADYIGYARLRFSDFRLVDEEKVEYKPENLVDRLSNKAKNPRVAERIYGAFKGRIIYIITDDEEIVKEHIKLLIEGLRLLRHIGIGRGVTRGYGVIRDIRIEARPLFSADEQADKLVSQVVSEINKTGVIR